MADADAFVLVFVDIWDQSTGNLRLINERAKQASQLSFTVLLLLDVYGQSSGQVRR